MRSLEYVSYAGATGYAIAAEGYVRLLVEAGFLVHWSPLPHDAVEAGRAGPADVARGRAAAIERSATGGGSRLRPLIEATSRPVDARVRILHLIPGHWGPFFSPMAGVRHVGMGVWETDRPPARWLPALAAVDHLCVPCAHNLATLAAAPGRVPSATVVPHVRRDALAPPPDARLAKLGDFLGVAAGDAVFYTIGDWAPRKRLAALLDGFARSFRREDPVALVVKTSRRIRFDDPASPIPDRDAGRVADAIVARAASELGRQPPRIKVIAEDDLADSFIDGLHALGHCFVTLSRSEGFGLGAFDAATHGRPVIAVGYGGPVDYLGTDWRGRVPHRMTEAENLSGYEWFDGGHLWPEPDDAAAFALMRAFAADPAPFRAEAETTATRIRRGFGAEAVTEALMRALDAVG